MASNEMFDFLMERGVSEDVIGKMKADKITLDVVKGMIKREHLGDLGDYLCLGDRIALRTYCQKSEASSSTRDRQNRKTQCYANIRKKLKLAVPNDDEEGVKKAQKMCVKQNAAKEHRKVQLSWIHNEIGVRAVNGGGTRDGTVQKSATKTDLMKMGKDLFFPNGRTKRGLEEQECDFELLDFSRCEMSDEISVGEMVESVRMHGKLRFYLKSTGPPDVASSSSALPPLDRSDGKSEGKSEKENYKQDENPQHPFSLTVIYEDDNFEDTSNCTYQLLMVQSPADNEVVFGHCTQGTSNSLDDTLPLRETEAVVYQAAKTSHLADQVAPRSYVQDVQSPPQTSLTQQVSVVTPEALVATQPPARVDVALPSQARTADSLAVLAEPLLESIDVPPRSPTPPPPQPPGLDGALTIRIHRLLIQWEMVSAFKNSDIMRTPLLFKLVDEKGEDAAGVLGKPTPAFGKSFLSRQCPEKKKRSQNMGHLNGIRLVVSSLKDT